jgi:nucleoside-diphosphate-sugar epimerase
VLPSRGVSISTPPPCQQSILIPLSKRSIVKRIVITGSSVSVTSDLDKPTVFTESDWHEAAVQVIKREGDKADPMAMYKASKVLAEKGMCTVAFQAVPADIN